MRLSKVVDRAVRPVVGRVVSPLFARGWRFRNRRKPRVLIYADSRGTNVTGPLGKSVFRTYVSGLMRSYCVFPVILPHRHTTLLDFLNFWDADAGRYDAVVLHCGIVDFSPRPASGIPAIVAAKSSDPGYPELFRANAGYYQTEAGPRYEGEPTTTLYSPGYLEESLLPRLRAIPNLVWVTTNDFVPGWDGNYRRGRPLDIGSRIADFEAPVRQALRHIVDLHAWSHADVQRFTIDNVHFTSLGFETVTALVRSRLDELLGSRRGR